MDTRDLTQALHEATAGLEPRAGFTDDVVAGGRWRRTRNRVTLASAVAATVAVAVVAVTGPTPVSAPPPPGASNALPVSKGDWRMSHQGGEHVDDPVRTTEIIEAWIAGLRPETPMADAADYSDRPGDPHVFWAGDTPYGEAAIVMEIVRLGPNDERILTGLVAAAPSSPEPRLLGTQVDGPGEQGRFVLPDNRTVLAVAPPDWGLWVSPEIRYTDEGSRRDWTALAITGGVGIGRLPDGANPLNARLAAGDPSSPPTRENAKLGAHLPMVVTGGYPFPDPPRPLKRGLPWTSSVVIGDQTLAPKNARGLFTDALRTSALLDPSSYDDEQRSPWLLTTARQGAPVVIVGEHQELDHPAYLYAVVLDPVSGEPGVERIGVVDQSATLPVVHRLADDGGAGTGGGWVVAALGKTLSHRSGPEEAWSAATPDAAWLPDDTTQVLVGDEVVNLF